MVYAGCALTVAVELLVFTAAGYGRRQYFLLLSAAVNVATNLSLNLLLPLHRSAAVLAVLEGLVVVIEYAVYAAAVGRSRRLLLLTLGANALSWGAGTLLFGLAV